MKLKLSIFMFFILSLNCLQAQQFVIPPKINLFQYSHSVSEHSLNSFPDTRIWGWSNNGKVAYSVERGLEGRGGQIIEFIIFDLVTDDIVFELRMDSFDVSSRGAEDEALYNVFKVSILNALKKYNIIQERTPFLSFPFMKNNFVYNVQITDYKYERLDGLGIFGDRVISSYRLLATSNNRRKVINTFSPESNYTGYVYICGYFLSPFENRALTVIAEESMGYGGDDLTFRFAGFHLDVGF